MEVSAVPASDYFFKTNEIKTYMDDVFDELLKQVNLMLMKDDIEAIVEEIKDEDEHQTDILFCGFNPCNPGIYKYVIIDNDTAAKTEMLSIFPANMSDGEKIISEAIEEQAALNDYEIQTVDGNIMAEEKEIAPKALSEGKKVKTVPYAETKKITKILKPAVFRLGEPVSQRDGLSEKAVTTPINGLLEKSVSASENKSPNKVADAGDIGYTSGEVAVKDIPGARIHDLSMIDKKEYLGWENIKSLRVEIVESMDLITEGKESLIEVRLNPRDLGKVHISLKLEEGKLVAKFLVKNENIKDILINSIDELSKSLKSQNIYIAKMEINVEQDVHGADSFDLNSNFGGQPNKDHDTGKNQSRWEGASNSGIQIQKAFDFKREGVSILA